MTIWEQDFLPFLDELPSYTDEDFYNFVKNFVGVIEGDILEIQRIKNVRILLQIPDVFSFFQINNKDILNLKERACFIADDSSYIVRPGIRSNMEQFIELLKHHYKPVTARNQPNGLNSCICDSVNINNGNTEYQSKSFVHIFVNNLMKNINRSSNNYRFDPIVNKFASIFNILAGHQAYEFVRMNLAGSLPSLTTLKNYNQNINLHLNEGEFRFDSLKEYLNMIDSNHVFVCEDSTSVVSSISYDSKTNAFIGFSPQLVNGLPLINQFQTNDFNELQQWFQDFEKSKLINTNLVEPLSNKDSSIHSRPYILSAYGTDNKYLGIDILRKWVYIYSECKKKNIVVVGFSSDCEARYLKAMQISLGFFTHTPNINLLNENKNLLQIDIPSTWTFFFMRTKQMYLCMQDGIHLATKIRNRLLSNIATLRVNNHQIHINDLFFIIDNYSKIDHNLVRSDIFPNDRQNFSSCVKITSDDVLNLLKEMNAIGTYIYLYLLKLVIITFIKADTDIFVRLYYGWILTFSYRMWWSSIQLEKKTCSQKEKDNFFITRAAWLSIEINIHCLTSLIILVLQGFLPSSSLNIHLFSSQPCETTFRSARSLSGTFSTMTNFSVHEFLNKIEKISILNHFKSTEANNVECPLKFPIHHKNQHKERALSTISLNSSSTTINDIETIIIKAYHQAEKLMDSLQLLQILRENDLDDINKLNSFVYQQLDLKSTVDYCYFNEIDLQDSADDIQNDIENTETDVEVEAYDSGEDNSDDYHFTTSKETFQGMKIFDKIDAMKKNNYFHIMINNKPKYLHKQTAARLLTTSKNYLSSDRLSRVQQTNKQK